MPRRRLGRSGVELSVVGLGGWQAGGGRTWGPNVDDGQVIAALRRGWEMGASWVDTAEVYADGRSEELIGRALCGHDEIQVMSKVGPRPDGSGVRPEEVRTAVEGSLRRLGREAVDLYLMHWRDPSIPLAETWGALGDLVERGLVRSIGLSNVCAAELQECAVIRPVEVLQLQASLLFREELEEMSPLCQRLGTGIVCYGPLAYGLLCGGCIGGDADWRSRGRESDDFFVVENFTRFFAPEALPAQQARVRAMSEVAAELELTVAQAALAWLLAQPGVTAAIVGSRSAAHIEENLRAAVVDLSRDQQQRLLGAVDG
jgi:methylglyoxal reductase